MKFETILLDADDTLFDFTACEKAALRASFEKHNYYFNESIRKRYAQINDDLWKRHEKGEIDRLTVIHSRFSQLFQEIGIQDETTAFEKDYQELLGMQNYMISGAKELLLYLKDKYNLYIVTNGITATQQRRLRESGIDRLVKEVFVSEQTGYQKPKKEFFDYCFARMTPLDKERTMIVGDSLSSDILGGNNAGIHTCWYNPSGLKNTLGVRIDYEIHHLADLREIL